MMPLEQIRFPITVDKLQGCLPHREPMLWITQVNWVDPEAGECLVQLDPEAHYMNGETIRRTSAIEWIAQAYGFIRACQNRIVHSEEEIRNISKAYLISIHEMEYSDNFNLLLRDVASLIVRVKRLRELNPIHIIHGEIITLQDEKVASGKVKVFSE